MKTSATLRRWMSGMTLRDEVAQLVFVAFPANRPIRGRGSIENSCG